MGWHILYEICTLNSTLDIIENQVFYRLKNEFNDEHKIQFVCYKKHCSILSIAKASNIWLILVFLRFFLFKMHFLSRDDHI